MKLDGKTVLLTGATGGLGRAIADGARRARREARSSCSRRQAEPRRARRLGCPGGPHRTIVADLAEEGEALRLLEAAGEIDVLVANAGLPASGRLDELQPGADRSRARVNLEAPVRMARELVPRLVERGAGPPRLHLLALGQGGDRPRVALLRDQVRAPRLRPRPARGPARRPASASRWSCPGAIRDAGMFADSGAAAPPLMGTGKPEQVGAAVVRAIERNRGEISVAPIRQRALSRDRRQRPGDLRAARRRDGDQGRRRDRQPARPTSASGEYPGAMSDSFSAKARCWRLGHRLRDLPARRASGEVRRRPAAVLAQGPAREHAAPRGRRVGVEAKDVETIASWDASAEPSEEIPFQPARVLMQDFTGVPAIVDLAAMRDAMDELGSDPSKINPLVPVDLVIDHSVQVDAFGNARAFDINADRDYERNRERYAFLRWGQQAFDNFRVVPPATGICHQVNLEYLSQVVFSQRATTASRQAYPDTLVGTDSHTTMVNGLGVLGWGVGGIEAEAAMLGQPISMLLPQVIGFRLDGELPEGATATDLVLTVTEMLRERGVVSKFVEFFGPGPAHARPRRPGDDRQHVAGVRLDLRDLPGRPRDAALPRVHRPADRDDRARRRLRARAGDVPRLRLRGPDLHRHARPGSRQRRAVDRRPEAPAGPDRAARTRSRRSSSRWRSSTPTPRRRSATAATRRSRSRSRPPTRRPRTTTARRASRACSSRRPRARASPRSPSTRPSR